ncbi:MAG: serine/threonine-protein kinase [Candidatus Margulisiibacteriota bacterium]
MSIMSGLESRSVAGVARQWLRPAQRTVNAIPSGRVREKSLAPKASDPPRFPFLIQGDLFAGFIIERQLGKGGFGAVYLASSPTHGWVALKISSRDMKDEAWAHAIAAGIEYKGLVDALDSGIFEVEPNEGYNWLAIRYVPGPTLAKLLRQDRRAEDWGPRALHPERARKIARKIALAAGEMHRRGIVHSDIKPANVILKNREALVLLDYGLTKQFPVPPPVDRIIKGTQSYMSPEQMKGESYGPPADVFAIGVVLWEMLTGEQARDNRQVQLTPLGPKAKPLPPLPPYILAKYQDIINKATADRPENRYPNGHALARALAEV